MGAAATSSSLATARRWPRRSLGSPRIPHEPKRWVLEADCWPVRSSTLPAARGAGRRPIGPSWTGSILAPRQRVPIGLLEFSKASLRVEPLLPQAIGSISQASRLVVVDESLGRPYPVEGIVWRQEETGLAFHDEV